MLSKIIVGALVTGLVVVGVITATRSSSQATPEAETSSLREAALAHEQAIAECMQDRGFDYVATLPADILLEEARAAADARGEDLEAALAKVELPNDPNDAIVAELSSDEAAAYETAYWGNDQRRGCYEGTYEEAWGVDIGAFGDALESALPEVEARIAADERIVEAKATYLSCMSKAGYDFDHVEDILTYPSRQSAETVKHITGIEGATGVPADDPEWLAHEERMERFEEARRPCRDAYDEVVRPIENHYLTGMAEESLP